MYDAARRRVASGLVDATVADSHDLVFNVSAAVHRGLCWLRYSDVIALLRHIRLQRLRRGPRLLTMKHDATRQSGAVGRPSEEWTPIVGYSCVFLCLTSPHSTPFNIRAIVGR